MDGFKGITLSGLISFGLVLLKAAVILLAGHFAVVFIIKLLSKSFERIKMDVSLEKFFLKVVNITLHIIVLLSALNALGISNTGLLAALSGAVVAVALALKDSLGSIAGGIIILLTKRFETGDYVEINGDEGTVVQVDLMHTTLKTLDNRHIVIPNAVAVNSRIIDYSSEEMRRLDIVFQIGYGDDSEKAKQLILDTVKNHKMSLNEPEEPFARVTGFGDSAVDITLRVWCARENYWQLKFDLLEQIKKAFDENGISIPFNQLDVHIKEK